MGSTEVGSDPASIWKFVSFILAFVVTVISGSLVAVAKMLLAEKAARLADHESIIEKLENAREARNRRETDRRDA